MEGGPSPGRPRSVAVVLAGAITKGAFEAGVLQVIAARGIEVVRIVAASSGALNGTAYAAGVRARRAREAAGELARLWQERGGLCHVLHPSLGDILAGRGLSDQRRLHAILRDSVRPSRIACPAPIELNLITAPLRGCRGSAQGEVVTTYTKVIRFEGSSFDAQEPLEQVLTAATASAALPGLYAPVALPGLGHCVDGGLVANTPIRYAYGDDGGASLDAVFVIAATPAALDASPQPFRGIALLAHVVDMLFSEWLYQDLRESRTESARIAALDALARQKGWSRSELHEIREALGWGQRHVVPIVSIRPVTPLPGTLFSGFTDAAMRRAYVAAGVERAQAVLDGLGWNAGVPA